MSDLRKKIIKLAHENPELRDDLLPLLKEAKSGLLAQAKKALPKWKWTGSQSGAIGRSDALSPFGIEVLMEVKERSSGGYDVEMKAGNDSLSSVSAKQKKTIKSLDKAAMSKPLNALLKDLQAKVQKSMADHLKHLT